MDEDKSLNIYILDEDEYIYILALKSSFHACLDFFLSLCSLGRYSRANSSIVGEGDEVKTTKIKKNI